MKQATPNRSKNMVRSNSKGEIKITSKPEELVKEVVNKDVTKESILKKMADITKIDKKKEGTPAEIDNCEDIKDEKKVELVKPTVGKKIMVVCSDYDGKTQKVLDSKTFMVENMAQAIITLKEMFKNAKEELGIVFLSSQPEIEIGGIDDEGYFDVSNVVNGYLEDHDYSSAVIALMDGLEKNMIRRITIDDEIAQNDTTIVEALNTSITNGNTHSTDISTINTALSTINTYLNRIKACGYLWASIYYETDIIANLSSDSYVIYTTSVNMVADELYKLVVSVKVMADATTDADYCVRIEKKNTTTATFVDDSAYQGNLYYAGSNIDDVTMETANRTGTLYSIARCNGSGVFLYELTFVKRSGTRGNPSARVTYTVERLVNVS